MIVPTRALALLVVGSIGLSAWGQVDARSTRGGGPIAVSSGPLPTKSAVARFPDVVERHTGPARCPRRELLESNPYGPTPERSTSPGDLSGLSIDEANPYGSVTLPTRSGSNLRTGHPCAVQEQPREPARLAKLDLANPYGWQDPLRGSAPAMQLDFENPYVLSPLQAAQRVHVDQ